MITDRVEQKMVRIRILDALFLGRKEDLKVFDLEY
jgi:hypothetical protein